LYRSDQFSENKKRSRDALQAKNFIEKELLLKRMIRKVFCCYKYIYISIKSEPTNEKISWEE
jgi:hypothetical protein